MPRWLWFLPLGLIGVVGALYAFRLGWLAANLTETDVINAYAARYVELAGDGARPTDCVARPGAAPVWLVVVCAPGDGREWRFEVGRLGGLLRQTGPSDAAPPGAPQT